MPEDYYICIVGTCGHPKTVTFTMEKIIWENKMEHVFWSLGVVKSGIQEVILTPPSLFKVCDNFSDYQFFMGESCDPEGMHVLVLYEGETPYLYFFKDGLEEEKVVSGFHMVRSIT